MPGADWSDRVGLQALEHPEQPGPWHCVRRQQGRGPQRRLGGAGQAVQGHLDDSGHEAVLVSELLQVRGTVAPHLLLDDSGPLCPQVGQERARGHLGVRREIDPDLFHPQRDPVEQLDEITRGHPLRRIGEDGHTGNSVLDEVLD